MSAVSLAAGRIGSVLTTVSGRVARTRAVPGLAVLCLLQLGEAVWFAFNTTHNGWVWHSGGDSTSFWTETWALGHLLVPPAAIGYGLPVYYAWIPLVSGPSLLNGLPVVAVLQLAVLVPLALVLFWLVADRLFGRVYAWFAAALWVAAPLLMLLGFVKSYHSVFEDFFLAPHWYGLTNMADFPSMVVVLAAAWLTLRAIDRADPTDYLLAGLMAGVALGLKPANGFFLPAVAVLLIATRRWQLAAVWVAGIVPALITLALWKERGLGYLPATSHGYQQLHVAAGAAMPLAFSTSHYIPLDFHHFTDELHNLREVFWSLRFLEFLVVAGLFGVIRRSPLKGVFVATWFVAFCVVKASTSGSDFPSATYFRLTEPGLPALILVVAGAFYCLPVAGRRLAPVAAPTIARLSLRDFDRRLLIPATTLCAVVPLLLIAIARIPSTDRTIRDENRVQEAPISNAFHLTAQRRGNMVTLRWKTPSHGSTTPSFLVFASGDNNGCDPLPRGARHCKFNTMPAITTTRATAYAVRLPARERQWFRVALVADYLTTDVGGDLMLMSPATYSPAAR